MKFRSKNTLYNEHIIFNVPLSSSLMYDLEQQDTNVYTVYYDLNSQKDIKLPLPITETFFVIKWSEDGKSFEASALIMPDTFLDPFTEYEDITCWGFIEFELVFESDELKEFMFGILKNLWKIPTV